MKNSIDDLEWLSSTGGPRHDTVVEDAAADEADDALDHILRQETDERVESSENVGAGAEDSMAGKETTEEASEATTLAATSEAGSSFTQDALDNSEPHENGFNEQEDDSQEIDKHESERQDDNTIASPCPPRLHAIEVVLAAPSDPDSYYRIHPSRTVLRVLGEIESIDDDDDDTSYEVEFRDGRIERVSTKSNRTGHPFLCLVACYSITVVWHKHTCYTPLISRASPSLSFLICCH